jgi:hypothetical protein
MLGEAAAAMQEVEGYSADDDFENEFEKENAKDQKAS